MSLRPYVSTILWLGLTAGLPAVAWMGTPSWSADIGGVGTDAKQESPGKPRSSVRFQSQGYILDVRNPESVAFTSTGADRVYAQIWQITNPKTVAHLYRNRSAQLIDEKQATDFLKSSGVERWHGDVAVTPASGQDKESSGTIPMAVLGDKNPYGAYAILASTTPDGPPQAMQWLLLGDLAASVLTANGSDLAAFVTTRHDGSPAVGVTLVSLDSGENEIGRAITDKDGYAHITGLSADRHPATIYALGPAGDFAIIDLTQTPELPPQIFVWGAQKIWKSGDTLQFFLLARKNGVSDAASLDDGEAEIYRPDGLLVARVPVQSLADGAYKLAWPLPVGAKNGDWRIVLRNGKTFETLKSFNATVAPDYPVSGVFPLFVRVLRDDLAGSGGMSLALSCCAQKTGDGHKPPPSLLPRQGVLHFSVQVKQRPEAIIASAPGGFVFTQAPSMESATAPDGEVDLAETSGDFSIDQGIVDVKFSRPVGAAPGRDKIILVSVQDSAGRRFCGQAEIVARTTGQSLVGIRPDFAGGQLPEKAQADFTLGVFAPNGKVLPALGLTYELLQEDYRYEWYMENGAWRYKVIPQKKIVSQGKLPATTTSQPFDSLHVPVISGRYELSVTDPASGAGASYRFTAGWWLSPERGPSPDSVEVTPMRETVAPGGKSWVFVRPPWDATVSLHVVKNTIEDLPPRRIDSDGAFIEVPTEAAWRGGAMLVAEARPLAPLAGAGHAARALGQAWIPLTDGASGLRNSAPLSFVAQDSRFQGGVWRQTFTWRAPSDQVQSQDRFAWFLVRDRDPGAGRDVMPQDKPDSDLHAALIHDFYGAPSVRVLMSGSDGDSRVLIPRETQDETQANPQTRSDSDERPVPAARYVLLENGAGNFDASGVGAVDVPLQQTIGGHLYLFAWNHENFDAAESGFDSGPPLLPQIFIDLPSALRVSDKVYASDIFFPEAVGDKKAVRLEITGDRGLLVEPASMLINTTRPTRPEIKIVARNPGLHTVRERLQIDGKAIWERAHAIDVLPLNSTAANPTAIHARGGLDMIEPGGHKRAVLPREFGAFIPVSLFPVAGLMTRLNEIYAVDPLGSEDRAWQGLALIRWYQVLVDSGLAAAKDLTTHLGGQLARMTQTQDKDGGFSDKNDIDSPGQTIAATAAVLDWMAAAQDTGLDVPVFTRTNAVRWLRDRLAEDHFAAIEWRARAAGLAALSRQKELPLTLLHRYAAEAPDDAVVQAALIAALQDTDLAKERRKAADKLDSGLVNVRSMTCEDLMAIGSYADRFPETLAAKWSVTAISRTALCAGAAGGDWARDSRLLVMLGRLPGLAGEAAIGQTKTTIRGFGVLPLPEERKSAENFLVVNTGDAPIYMDESEARRATEPAKDGILPIPPERITVAASLTATDGRSPVHRGTLALYKVLLSRRMKSRASAGENNSFATDYRFVARLPSGCSFVEAETGGALGTAGVFAVHWSGNGPSDRAAINAFAVCDLAGDLIFPAPALDLAGMSLPISVSGGQKIAVIGGESK